MSLLSDARAYANARFGTTYSAWAALSDADATKTLTNAADYLNHQPWQGTFVGTLTLSTDLVWPRSGVIVDGVEISSASTPADVLEAQYEMAFLVLANPAVTTKADQGSNIRSAGGGGAPTVEFFVPTSAAAGTASTIPFVIAQRIAKYLATPNVSASAFGQPGESCSSFGTGSQFLIGTPR